MPRATPALLHSPNGGSSKSAATSVWYIGPTRAGLVLETAPGIHNLQQIEILLLALREKCLEDGYAIVMQPRGA